MTIQSNDPRFNDRDRGAEWMKPYIDQANEMIRVISLAMAAGKPVPPEQIGQWKVELKNFLTVDDVDFMRMLLETQHPEQLVLLAGRIIGRESRRRANPLVESVQWQNRTVS